MLTNTHKFAYIQREGRTPGGQDSARATFYTHTVHTEQATVRTGKEPHRTNSAESRGKRGSVEIFVDSGSITMIVENSGGIK